MKNQKQKTIDYINNSNYSLDYKKQAIELYELLWKKYERLKENEKIIC